MHMEEAAIYTTVRLSKTVGQEAAVDTSLNALNVLSTALNRADLLTVYTKAKRICIKVLL